MIPGDLRGRALALPAVAAAGHRAAEGARVVLRTSVWQVFFPVGAVDLLFTGFVTFVTVYLRLRSRSVAHAIKPAGVKFSFR